MNTRKEWISSQTESNSQYQSKEDTINEVKENFDIRRNYSTEGYSVKFTNDISPATPISITDWVLIQSHTNPINQNKEDKKIHFPANLSITRGCIVDWLIYNEKWMIISRIDNLLAYKSAQIYKTNYILEWLNAEGKEISEECIIENFKFSDDDTIRDTKYMTTGEGVRYITLQYNSNTNKIKRDKRFIICDRAYKVIEYDYITKSGLVLLTCAEHQITDNIDLIRDDGTGIADYYNHKIIPVVNDDVFTISLTPSNTSIMLGRSLELTAHLFNNEVEDLSKHFQFTVTNVDGTLNNYVTVSINNNVCKITSNNIALYAGKYINVYVELVEDPLIHYNRQIKLVSLI